MSLERIVSGAASGCHKSRLERWAANRPLTLRSHALEICLRDFDLELANMAYHRV